MKSRGTWVLIALVCLCSVYYFSKVLNVKVNYDSAQGGLVPKLSFRNEAKIKKTKIFTWIATYPAESKSKRDAVRRTWAKRMDGFTFFSSKALNEETVTGLNITEGRDMLTEKTWQAFQYIYDHYLNDFDWFMKADTDTFVFVENLRYFLHDKDSSKPVVFGRPLREPENKVLYNSGGAGYVLSKEALRRFVRNKKACEKFNGIEDLAVGACLEKLGVVVGSDTRDKLGKTRFHALFTSTHLQPELPSWINAYSSYTVKAGPEKLSTYPVTFHYVNPVNMYLFEYLLYSVNVFDGVLTHNLSVLNEPPTNT